MPGSNKAGRRRPHSGSFSFEPLEQRWAMAASLSLTMQSEPVYEGDQVQFTLALSEPSRVAERVFVTTSPGTATYGTDYYARPKTQILFSPGQTRQTFTISTLREAVDRIEGAETFQVIATPATAALGARAVTVSVNDFLPPPLIRINNVTLTEGDEGTTPATFQITLSAPTNRPITVAYATKDGSATVADNDYTPGSGALTFAPGEVSKTVNVSVIGDRKLESNETFSLALTPPAYGIIQRGVGTATIRNDEPDQPGFQITVNYIGAVLPSVRTAVNQATAKWQQVITGDVPSFVNPFNGQWVDDIVLDVRMGLLGPNFPTGTDGAVGPNTIANAGPFFGGAPGVIGDLAIRNDLRLPYWGAIGFDPANAVQDSLAELTETAIHEIAHALGFGWPLFFEPRPNYPNGLVVGTVADLVFVGVNAVREYNTIFSASVGSIPMENEGGGGTAGVHWDDGAMPGELMTGSATEGISPLSKISVGAMADLGYAVNYAAADTYRNPAARVAASMAAATASSGSPASASAIPKPITKLLSSPTQPNAAVSISHFGQRSQPATSKPPALTVATVQNKPPLAPSLPKPLAFSMLGIGADRLCYGGRAP